MIARNHLDKALLRKSKIFPFADYLSGQYGDDLSESSLCVQYMWTAIAQLTLEERSRFLRFVTGRKRPPAPFTVSKASGDLDCLPNASTCGSTLFLPDYTTAAVATEKLR